MPSLRGIVPGSTIATVMRRPVCSRNSWAKVCAERLAVGDLGRRLAFDGQLVEWPMAFDDQAVVRRRPFDAQQQLLDVGGVDVDAADDQHVVVAAAQAR